MKKYLSLLLIVFSSLFAINSFAFTPPPAPAKGWYVSDQAGKLSPAEIARLNQKIEHISKATKNEFGILLLQDMGGENIEDVAHATFKAWGVGKRGLDNGLLIVVSIKERKSRIETGKGVGGEVTDLQANSILKKNLAPHLKRGDFAGGFHSTLDALSSLMESRANQKAEPPPRPQPVSCAASGVGTSTGENTGIYLGGALALFAAGLILLELRARRKRREHAAAMRKIDEEFDRARIEHEKTCREVELQMQLRAQEQARRAEQERKAREAKQKQAATLKSMPSVPPPLPKKPIVIPVVAPSSPPEKYYTPPVARKSAPASNDNSKKDWKPFTPSPSIYSTPAPKPTPKRDNSEELAREEARRQERKRQEREEEERVSAQRRRDEDDRRRREDEARRRREQDEEDDRRRRSSSSSSSFDWGSNDSGGGGFGGGDTGGGGSSSDW